MKRWDRRQVEKIGRKDKEKHRLQNETQIVEKRQKRSACKQQNKKGDQREEGKQQALQDTFDHMILLDASHVDEETACPCCGAVYGGEPNTTGVCCNGCNRWYDL